MNEIERLKTALMDAPGAESTAKSFGVLIPIIETPHGLSVLFEVRARNLRASLLRMLQSGRRARSSSSPHLASKFWTSSM